MTIGCYARFIALVVAGILISAGRAQSTRPADVAGPGFDETMLRPLCTVAMIPPPVVDGVADAKGEYTWGPALTDFVSIDDNDDNGVASSDLTYCWLGYDENNLYVAFRIEMPEGTSPKSVATDGQDVGFDTDDGFEFYLAPEPHARRWRIGGNSAGVTWECDESNPAAPNWGWNPNITYKATVDGTGWQGEYSIPWTQLGVTCPKVGESWRANFIARRRAMNRTEAWSYWRHDGDINNNGRLVFGARDRGYFKLAQPLGRAFTWHTIAVLTYYGTKGGTRSVDADFQFRIFRRDPRTHDMRSFYRDVHSAGDPIEAVRKVTATYEPLPDLDHSKRVRGEMPVHPGYGTWGHQTPYMSFDQPGEYLLQYYITDQSAPNEPPHVVAGAARTFRIDFGITARAWPYLLTRRSVVMQADIRGLGNKRAEAATLIARVTPAGQPGKVVAEARSSCSDLALQEVEVPAETLPLGSYEAHVEVIDRSGASMAAASTSFKTEQEPEWWVNRARYGAKPEVPPPWTPIEWESAGVARVWGRETTFGDSPLPRRIVRHGEQILAAPIELELVARGQPQAWMNRSLKLSEQKSGHVVFETLQEAAGVRVRGRVTHEFDGFSLVDLTIEPTHSETPVHLDKLDLVIPVRGAHAQFLTNYAPAPGPGLGRQRDLFGNFRYIGKTPDHYESPVMLTTWIGNDHGGIEWSCESSKGWSVSNLQKAIEVDRSGDVVTARFHFIDHPLTLDRPRTIRFGLIVTPTKPVAPHRWNWRIDGTPAGPPRNMGENPPPEVQREYEQWRAHFVEKARCDVFAMLTPYAFSGNMAFHPRITEPAVLQTVRSETDVMNRHGIRSLWNGGWAASTAHPMWDPWGKEMAARPLTPTWANQVNISYDSPYVEFMLGSYTWHAREAGIRGVRFDTVVPWIDSQDPWRGEAWQADDGKTYGSQGLFRQREMLKRFYRIFHGGEVEDGCIYLAIAGPPIMAVESFEDIHEIGEGAFQKAPTLKEGYPQDKARVWMSGRPYGFITQNNLKGGPLTPSQRLAGLLAAGADGRLSVRPGVGTEGAYGPGLSTLGIWRAWSWVDRGSARFCPHWENAPLQATNSDPSGADLYTTFYLQPGRRIALSVSNYETSPVNATVQLKLEELGFPADTPLQARDAITGEPVAVSQGRLDLPIEPQLFRLVMIGIESELNGPPLDTMH